MNSQYEAQSWIRSIARLQLATSIVPILKGYSSDQKFLVRTEEHSYVVKFFEYTDFAAKQAEYDALITMALLGVKCSQPIELGRLELADKGYLIVSYVEGESAEEALPRYTSEQQYEIGFEAGKELLKIHQAHCPAPIGSWYERKAAKHAAYMERYRQLRINIPQDELIIAYIDQHLHLMKDRPNLFQHDDYHPSNLIIRQGELSGVIDFNRCDWGDPFHEFLKIGMFSVEVSQPFSIGQLHGYFNGQQPSTQFWQLYTLYVAMCLISSIVWIEKVKPSESSQMMERIVKVMEDHDYFNRIIPSWYIS